MHKQIYKIVYQLGALIWSQPLWTFSCKPEKENWSNGPEKWVFGEKNIEITPGSKFDQG